jgi:glycosyltransferase involved in cell wall biosynthesis
MKIAILGSRGIPASYGGFETFAENLAVGLAKEGYDVGVYCPSYQKYQEKTYNGASLVHIICWDNLFENRVIRAIANLLYDILSLIHVSFSKYDLVYMLGYASGPALVIPRLFGKTVVVNPDGLEWKSKRWGLGARIWLYLCEMVSAKWVNGLIADAQPIQEHFREKYGVEPACIPYGAEFPGQQPGLELPYAPGGYYLSVARMVPETSIPLMIRGFKASGSDKKMVIIGPVPDAKFFEAEVTPLFEEGRIVYLGPIYDRELLRTYRTQARALLHGHASDGTNPSLLESMGFASPVVAIGTKSNAAVLGENDGLYFRDEIELAKCIRRLDASDEAGLRALGERNRAIIEEHYGWATAVANHLTTFKNAFRK